MHLNNIKMLVLIFENILFPPLWITSYYFTALINSSFLLLSTKQLFHLSPSSQLQSRLLPVFCPWIDSFHPTILDAFSVDYSFNIPAVKFSKLISKGIDFHSTFKIQEFQMMTRPQCGASPVSEHTFSSFHLTTLICL